MEILGTARRRRMLGLNVALLAEPGSFGLKKSVMLGAVGGMAVEAILPDRGMFPEKWPLLFRVAGQAILVDRGLLEKGRAQAPVGVMAVGATHLALPQGHVGGTLELGLLDVVALKAGVHLRGLREEMGTLRALAPVHAVAGEAGDVPGVMGPSLPVLAGPALVAFQAGSGHLPAGGFLGILDGEKIGITLVAAGPRVEGARAVAFFAGLGKLDSHDFRPGSGMDVFLEVLPVGMAGQAGLRSHELGLLGLALPPGSRLSGPTPGQKKQ
jgi:hypothetical protein